MSYKTAVKTLAAMSISLAALACSAKDVYLFAYFTGEKDGLHLAYSYDGLEWKALNDNRSLLAPQVGKDRLMRDPSICQGPDGTFHMVWTSSWYDKIIGYASSKDLIHWSAQKALPVMMHEPTTKNSWAPEITYDDETGEFYIYWASTIPDRHSPVKDSEREKGWNHRIYLTTTRDFETFTPTRLWFNPDWSAIDSAVIKTPEGKPKKWMMVVKNENPNPAQKTIHAVFTDHLKDGFPTEVGPALLGIQWLEGPAPLAVGSDIYCYMDSYRNKKYMAACSHDGGVTWENVTDRFVYPRGIRHGTAFKVDEKYLAPLLRLAEEREIPGCQGTHVAPDGDTITVTSKCLRRNGEVQVPVMGEMHFSRVPDDEWRDYVRKMKAGGVTIVASYVFWIHHEEKEAEFDFTGRRDIRKFLGICKDEGLDVVLRIGPWGHGECRNGGFPEWAVERFGKRLRTQDAEYLAAVERFWRRLYGEVDGFLFKQGGPVVGIQLENECSGPWPYMMALKKLAVGCGFDVPFYTRTGWPVMRGNVDFGELLPLFGDYADGFWERNTTAVSPGNYRRAFKFSDVRVSANIATEQLPQSLTDDNATAQYPFFTCELGGGMASSYHRRLRVAPLDTYAMALVKLGSGSNMPGYYMYAGGTNPNRAAERVYFNECQASDYTNHNDLPAFSYEFQAPISEFGETTLSWTLLRNLNKFCASFAADFALEEPEILSEREAVRGPFHFCNEWVRGSTNVAERTKIPHIFPRDWKTRLGTIKMATAQPVEWDGDTLVMMKVPGFEPKVEFEGKPFSIRYIDFPASTDTFPYVPEKVLDVQPAFALVKPAGPAREIKAGPRGVAMQPSEEEWGSAAEFSLELPQGTTRDAIMEVAYLGDCARIYVDGLCVADDFFKGLPLRCALWRIPEGKITMRILPWTDSPLVFVEPPLRPAETGARIDSIRLVERR